MVSCLSTAHAQRDMTEEAAALVALVRGVGSAGSLGHVADVFRGGLSRAVKGRGQRAHAV